MSETTPEDDGALFPEPVTPDGRHATAFRRAFTAAEDSNLLGDVDAALMSVALAGAAALDDAVPAAGEQPVTSSISLATSAE